jgi:Winged helix-turn-helix domain (DUF2582)
MERYYRKVPILKPPGEVFLSSWRSLFSFRKDFRKYAFWEIKTVRRRAMIQSIGDTAGKVWRLLDEKGETKLSELKKGVGADPNLVLQAIGWLAREDKLLIEKKGRYIAYSLKEGKRGGDQIVMGSEGPASVG